MPDIVLKDRAGNDISYTNKNSVFVPDTSGGLVEYFTGEKVEKTIDPDFSEGNMEVMAEAGTFLEKVTIIKPETLIPENIVKDKIVAGIRGTHESGSKVLEIKSASGSFTPTSTSAELTISHGMKVIPDEIFIVAENPATTTKGLRWIEGKSTELAQLSEDTSFQNFTFHTGSDLLTAAYTSAINTTIDDETAPFINNANPNTFKLTPSDLVPFVTNVKHQWVALGGLVSHPDVLYLQLALGETGTLYVKGGTSLISQLEIYVDGVHVDTVDYSFADEFVIDTSNYGDKIKTHCITVKPIGENLDEFFPQIYVDTVTGWLQEAAIYGVSGMYDANPALTRTDDAVGMGYTINSNGTIQSDFNSVFPWSEAKLVSDSKSNQFIQMPGMWFRVGYDDNYRITDIAVSKTSHAEGEWYYVEPFCYGRYVTNYNDTTTMVSKSGITMSRGATRANLRTYAKNNGSNYHINDLRNSTIMKFLWWIEWATKNAPSIMTGCYSGAGTTGGNAKITTGATNSLSTPSGYELTRNRMRWHYIEDFVGGLSVTLDGVYLKGLSGEIYATDNIKDYNDSTTYHNKLAYTNPAYDRTCIKAYGWDPNHPFLSMPCETSETTANYTSYFCTAGYGYSDTKNQAYENCNYNYTNGGLGGGYNGFMLNMQALSVANINMGTRLMYRGTLV